MAKFFRMQPAQPFVKAAPDSAVSANWTALRTIREVLTAHPRVKLMTFLSYFITARCSKRRKKFQSMLRESKGKFERELDLRRFIARQRMHATAIMALLNGKQHVMAARMSKLFLRSSAADSVESNSTDESCSSSSSERVVEDEESAMHGNNSESKVRL